jgi:raffinose/stachyose/melibiose transport system permease protein
MLNKNRLILSIKPAIALLIIAVHIIPFYILISVSFKNMQDISSYWRLPNYFSLANFKTALIQGRMYVAICNSLIVTSISVTLVVVIGAITAYPLARIPNKMNKMLFNTVLGVMMVPSLTVIVPLYKLMVSIHGINKLWGVIIAITTYRLPLSIFLYTNFITTCPRELDEAALIDGCDRLAVFYRIILPILKPVTATVIILTSISVWNDFSFSLYFLQKPALHTITLAISSFFGDDGLTDLHSAAAGALLAILPPVILYLSMQKYFIKGLMDSAVKG